jgi:hypothetical protein
MSTEVTMAYKERNKPVIHRIVYDGHIVLPDFIPAVPIEELWFLYHFNSDKWNTEWKDKAKQKVKSIELMYFSFPRMIYCQ